MEDTETDQDIDNQLAVGLALRGKQANKDDINKLKKAYKTAKRTNPKLSIKDTVDAAYGKNTGSSTNVKTTK